MKIEYKFDAKELVATYGVKVQSASGLLDIPPRKDIQKYDFNDSNGYSPELSTVVYQERKIDLECFIKATDGVTLMKKYNTFSFDLQSITEVKVFVATITPSTGTAKTLTFNVYCDKISLIKKKLRDGTTFGFFTVSLIEPEPTISAT